jgi:zinc transporter ZupT
MTPPRPTSRSPRWYGVPVRVLLLTFLGTLLCFAVSLLLGILGAVIGAALRGVHPDLRAAYRAFAIPLAVVAGCVVFVCMLVVEIRHYRQAKTLAVIEKIS